MKNVIEMSYKKAYYLFHPCNLIQIQLLGTWLINHYFSD
jgi:hypothetical protein